MMRKGARKKKNHRFFIRKKPIGLRKERSSSSGKVQGVAPGFPKRRGKDKVTDDHG